MNLKNIFSASAFFGLLTVLVCASVIVNPLFWCVSATVGLYTPELVEELD